MLKTIYGREYVQDRINGLININRTHGDQDRVRNMRLALDYGFGNILSDAAQDVIIASIQALDPGIVSVTLD